MALGDLEVKGKLKVVGTTEMAGFAKDATLITSLNADQVDSADKDTDGTLSGNSDSSIPTEKAVKTYADARKAECVALTGDQTVAGIKTLSSIPVLPASNPTTDNQAARKAYVDGAIVAGIKETGTAAATIKCKVIEIGDWNMDSTVYVDINHGLTLAKIRTVGAMIRSDTADTQYPTGVCSSSGAPTLWIGGLTASQVNIRRLDGSVFDSSSFDSTSYNRGWIVIWYEA